MPITVYSHVPTASSSNVNVFSSVSLIFSTCVDEHSIGTGTVFIEGSDRDILSGPYVPVNYFGSSIQDILTDPSYYGIVRGSYTLDRVQTDSTTVTTALDTAGTSQYYSRLIIKPEKPLAPLTRYTVYAVGTGTDTTPPGISRRTVFDAVAGVGNTGNGTLCAYGGHTASGTHTYTVEIVSSGVVGNSIYRWCKNAETYSAGIRTHSYKRTLQDGVSLAFSPVGTYEAADSFTFKVREPEYMTGIYLFYFVSGQSATPVTVGSASSLLSTAAPPSVYSPFPGLALAYTYPASPGCNIGTDQTAFTFYFNKALNTAINTQGVEIYVGAPDGDTSVRTATQYYATSYSVSGSALTINL